MPCGSLRSALRPSAMLRHAPCLAASTRYDRHRILPSWRRRTIGTLRAEGQMRPIPALQRFSRRELIPPPRPAVQEPAALPNGQKEGGLAIHTVLLCLFGQSTTWGYACAAPSSSPESGTCRSLRLPNRPFFDRNRPFPRHGRGSPSQPPPLMACARAARISSACLQHQTEGPMRAHRWRMQGRRRSRGGVRSRGGTKQGGTKQGDTRQGDVPRKTERLLLRPVRMQNLASLHEETRSSVAKPPLRPYRLRRRRTCNHYLPAGAPGK